MRFGMRILFQGDSITDAGRDRRNYHDLKGYSKFAAEQLRERCPEKEMEFINLGISGNRTSQLFDRAPTDLYDLQPDIVSILIGINDVWHRYGKSRIPTSDAQFELNYRTLLAEVRKQTNAKILILCPYLLDAEQNQHFRADVDRMVAIVERLAAEFADAYVPLDALFAKALLTQPEPLYYSVDAVHPNENGARFIAAHYVEAIAPLIERL